MAAGKNANKLLGKEPQQRPVRPPGGGSARHRACRPTRPTTTRRGEGHAHRRPSPRVGPRSSDGCPIVPSQGRHLPVRLHVGDRDPNPETLPDLYCPTLVPTCSKRALLHFCSCPVPATSTSTKQNVLDCDGDGYDDVVCTDYWSAGRTTTFCACQHRTGHSLVPSPQPPQMALCSAVRLVPPPSCPPSPI